MATKILSLLGLDEVVKTVKEIYGMDKRTLFRQVLNLALVVSSAIMIWQSLIVVSGSESPVVVVLRFVIYLLLYSVFFSLIYLYYSYL